MKLLLILFVVGFSHLGLSQDEGSGEPSSVFAAGKPISVDELNKIIKELRGRLDALEGFECPEGYVKLKSGCMMAKPVRIRATWLNSVIECSKENGRLPWASDYVEAWTVEKFTRPLYEDGKHEWLNETFENYFAMTAQQERNEEVLTVSTDEMKKINSYRCYFDRSYAAGLVN